MFEPPGPGHYWVTESVAPPGYDVAEPVLVDFSAELAQQNCSQVGSALECVPDDDQSGGFVLTFVADSPTGGVLPTTLTLPPTETRGQRPKVNRLRRGSSSQPSPRSSAPRC